MFYPIEIPKSSPDKKQAAALVVLNPAQSRRLVAKGAIASPIFQKAYKSGMIINSTPRLNWIHWVGNN